MCNHLWLQQRLLSVTILVVVLAINPNSSLIFDLKSYAQEMDSFYREIQQLYGEQAAKEIPVFAPKNYAIAKEFYNQAMEGHESGESLENVQHYLQQSRTYLELAYKSVEKIKQSLQNLILLRDKALELKAKEYAANLFIAAENIFQRVVSQADEGNERIAKSFAVDAETIYRQAILITVREGFIRVAEEKLEQSPDVILPEKQEETVKNFEEAKELFTQAQSNEVVTSEFLNLIDGIRSRIRQLLELIESEGGVKELPFVEKYPAWNRPDLTVNNMTVEPERANPGDLITFQATVSNFGTGRAKPATLTFQLDGEKIANERVDSLAPAAEVMIKTVWTAEGSGCHLVLAKLIHEQDAIDANSLNNLKTTTVRISGETSPEPELEFSEIGFSELQLQSGESCNFPLKVHNPSYATIQDIPFDVYINGENESYGKIDYLSPGEDQELLIPWSDVTPGQHIITIQMDLPETFPDVEFKKVVSWNVAIPDKSVMNNSMEQGKWISIGPNILNNGSVGRMDCIAFHPKNPNIIYAGSPSGGIWKTTNRGDNWKPIGDGLPSLNVSAIAVDPNNPDIVYLATRDVRAYGTSGMGIFKSLDGGATPWKSFASKNVVGNVTELFIRYTSLGEVVIYAGSDRGVMRYKSRYPKFPTSFPKDWVRIKSGGVLDIAVDPKDVSLVYASMYKDVRRDRFMDGLFRTTKGDMATGDGDWVRLNKGLPKLENSSHWLHLDIFKMEPAIGPLSGLKNYLNKFKSNEKILYAAILFPKGKYRLRIYKSANGGDSWIFLRGATFSGYNDFIRVHPIYEDLLYYGGVKLHKIERISFGYPSGFRESRVSRIHDDMKALEFDPFDSDFYYILNDGGIWRCEINGINFGFPSQDISRHAFFDRCTHRNTGLRTTQFYDLDASQTDSKLLIGGTQDNGTILYEGKLKWRKVKDGDGNFALIAPGNKIFYAQHQSLKDDYGTSRCDNGANCGPNSWQKANNGLPDNWGWDNAYFTCHPTDPKVLISQGDQVYYTSDSGKNWTPMGPKSAEEKEFKGHIRRVLFQPQSFYWIAGTSSGQIWYTDGIKRNPFYDPEWNLVFRHPHGATVRNMALAPTDKNVLYVIFDIGIHKANTRIYRIHLNLDDPTQPAVAALMGAGFPTNITPKVICGDGYDINIAYVGTNQAGVFRWDARQPAWNAWQHYNDGLPRAVDVRDLLVDPKSKELRAATWGRGAWSVITGP